MSTSARSDAQPHAWRWALAGPALAVGLALGMVSLTDPGSTPRPAQRVLKDGPASLELVRVRGGTYQASPEEVAVGDRLGLRLTCPIGPKDLDVVVFYGEEGTFPVARAEVGCGDRVQLPGSFTADAPGPLVACVAIGELPSREVLASGPRQASLCVKTEVIAAAQAPE